MRLARLLVCMLLAWWPMMVVHETGHILGACLTGATIDNVVLWPWMISETTRSGSPAPLIDTWAGPVVGAVVPLTAFVLLRRRGRRWRGVTGFFAGFCLIANGLYLGLGWIDHVGDAGDLVRLGMPIAVLVAFGVIACVGGFYLWHRLDRARPSEG